MDDLCPKEVVSMESNDGCISNEDGVSEKVGNSVEDDDGGRSKVKAEPVRDNSGVEEDDELAVVQNRCDGKSTESEEVASILLANGHNKLNEVDTVVEETNHGMGTSNDKATGV
ncbi:hypothetical protein CsSME_00038792 [Camellia sinensis var. sinensis]